MPPVLRQLAEELRRNTQLFFAAIPLRMAVFFKIAHISLYWLYPNSAWYALFMIQQPAGN